MGVVECGVENWDGRSRACCSQRLRRRCRLCNARPGCCGGHRPHLARGKVIRDQQRGAERQRLLWHRPQPGIGGCQHLRRGGVWVACSACSACTWCCRLQQPPARQAAAASPRQTAAPQPAAAPLRPASAPRPPPPPVAAAAPLLPPHLHPRPPQPGPLAHPAAPRLLPALAALRLGTRAKWPQPPCRSGRHAAWDCKRRHSRRTRLFGTPVCSTQHSTQRL